MKAQQLRLVILSHPYIETAQAGTQTLDPPTWPSARGCRRDGMTIPPHLEHQEESFQLLFRSAEDLLVVHCSVERQHIMQTGKLSSNGYVINVNLED